MSRSSVSSGSCSESSDSVSSSTIGSSSPTSGDMPGNSNMAIDMKRPAGREGDRRGGKKQDRSGGKAGQRVASCLKARRSDRRSRSRSPRRDGDASDVDWGSASEDEAEADHGADWAAVAAPSTTGLKLQQRADGAAVAAASGTQRQDDESVVVWQNPKGAAWAAVEPKSSQESRRTSFNLVFAVFAVGPRVKADVLKSLIERTPAHLVVLLFDGTKEEREATEKYLSNLSVPSWGGFGAGKAFNCALIWQVWAIQDVEKIVDVVHWSRSAVSFECFKVLLRESANNPSAAVAVGVMFAPPPRERVAGEKPFTVEFLGEVQKIITNNHVRFLTGFLGDAQEELADLCSEVGTMQTTPFCQPFWDDIAKDYRVYPMYVIVFGNAKDSERELIN